MKQIEIEATSWAVKEIWEQWGWEQKLTFCHNDLAETIEYRAILQVMFRTWLGGYSVEVWCQYKRFRTMSDWKVYRTREVQFGMAPRLVIGHMANRTRTIYALVARRLQLSHDLCSFNLWNPSFFGIPGILVILSLHCTSYSRIDK